MYVTGVTHTGYVVGADFSGPCNAFVEPNLYALDDAETWYGGQLAFVGRYIDSGGGAAVPLTTDEVNWIVNVRGKCLLPIYSDSPINGGTTGTYAIGQQDAMRATTQARAIGIPLGVYIAGDVESGAAVTADWVRGWCDAMRQSVYAGSGILYGMAGAMAGASGNLGQAYLQALAADRTGNVRRLILWDARWISKTGYTVNNTPFWSPDVPSIETHGAVRVWQMTGGVFGGVCDLDMIDDTLLKPGQGLVTPQQPATPAQPAPPPPTPPTSAMPGVLASALAQAQSVVGSIQQAQSLLPGS